MLVGISAAKERRKFDNLLETEEAAGKMGAEACSWKEERKEKMQQTIFLSSSLNSNSLI